MFFLCSANPAGLVVLVCGGVSEFIHFSSAFNVDIPVAVLGLVYTPPVVFRGQLMQSKMVPSHPQPDGVVGITGI